MSDTPTFTTAELAQFTGSQTFYRHWANRRCVFTEGVHYLAERAHCYWLIDAILLVQPHEPRLKAEDFQVWTLTVREDRSAVLTCTDSNDNFVYAKDIPWTDFPLDTIELWFAGDTLYLRSEH